MEPMKLILVCAKLCSHLVKQISSIYYTTAPNPSAVRNKQSWTSPSGGLASARTDKIDSTLPSYMVGQAELEESY